MITLYNVPVSSYGCKIRILLTHKNMPSETIAPPDGYGSPAYCKIIPAGTVPAIDHDGFRLSDSEAIAEYLNELSPSPPMLPANIQERAHAREISRFHDTRLEPVLRAYFGQVAPASRNPEFIAENAALLQKRLDQLAQMFTPQPLLFGTDLTIPDCSFVASFAIFRVLDEILNFDITMPDKLVVYEAALAAHPSVIEARDDYYDALDLWAKAKLSA